MRNARHQIGRRRMKLASPAIHNETFRGRAGANTLHSTHPVCTVPSPHWGNLKSGKWKVGARGKECAKEERSKGSVKNGDDSEFCGNLFFLRHGKFPGNQLQFW